MIVVSDASPLMNLAAIGLLDILREMFSPIIIPPTVYDEIVVLGSGKAGSEEVQASTWIEIVSPKNESLLKELLETLDPGESEAIALAIELDADLLLIDESMGRSIARSYDLTIVGLLGVLLSAKGSSLIKQVAPYINKLEEEAQFYISSQLKAEVLRLAGE